MNREVLTTENASTGTLASNQAISGDKPSTRTEHSAISKRKLSSDNYLTVTPKRIRTATTSSSIDDEDRTSYGHTPLPSEILDKAWAANQGKGGVLGGAQNVVVKGSNMLNVETQNIYLNDRSNDVLPWLGKHAMRGAEFDSSARDPPPRCHPGTRTAIIRSAHDWLDDPKRKKKLLWLHGPAGVGKSAIVQTLAEVETVSQRLGASLFFSRINHLNEPEKVFPTLAYQLAVRDPSYKAYLADVMLDPGSLDKAISEQFRRLIIEPFAERRIRSNSEIWVIALDGLDECGGTQGEHNKTQLGPSRHSDDYQREIVELISKFALEHPSVPLIWIISSRPEPHLKAAFSQDSVAQSFWEIDIPVDSDDACRDVEKYLRSKFNRIRAKYPSHISGETWPSNADFLKVTRAASGLFAFASAIILFVGDPWFANPVDQLDRVLLVIDKLSILDGSRNPLAALDGLYTEILRRIPPNIWPVTKQLVAASIFLDSPSTLVFMCNVFRITQGAAVTALRHLYSVIKIPRIDEIGGLHLRFYHASFRDYLKDPSRSSEYAIDTGVMQKVAKEWCWGLLRILRQAIGTPDAPAMSPESVPRLNNISLSWACQEHIKKELVEEAQRTWYYLMEGRFQGNDYSFSYFWIEIQVPASEILSIVEKLDFKLIGYYTPRSHEHYGPTHTTLTWFLRLANHFQEELERRGILSYATLESLDIGSVDYTQTKCSRNYGTFSKEVWKEPLFDILQHRVEHAPFTEVAIWANGDRRCAMLEITELSNGMSHSLGIILPGV